MTKYIHKSLLAVVPLLMAVLFFACKKDPEKKSTAVELLSFGPTGAHHGDTIKFIGLNLDKVTAIHFTGVNAVVDKSEFTLHTPELILVQVPDAAEKGKVTLKTTDGDIVSKTEFNIGALPTVSSITDEARPQTNITITGAYLNWVTRITFAKDKPVEQFVSQSFNQLVVTVPEDAETGPLTITYSGTDSGFFETDQVLEVTLPKATAFSPNPVKHGAHVTITGTDLDLVRKVYFTNEPDAITSFVSQTATELVVTVPAAASKGPIKLEAASGVQTTSADDLDVLLPVITSFSPSPVDPGDNLTITGANLDLVSEVAIQGVSPITSFVSQSPTQLVLTVPSGAANGLITLKVKNSTLTVSSTDVLEIVGWIPPPTLSLYLYDDAITSNWNGWVGNGWGGTRDYNNTSPVRGGIKSIRIDFNADDWGSPFQLGGGNLSLASYTTFHISIYGAPGSEGKKILLQFNSTEGYEITLGPAGQWVDYAIPLSSISSADTVTEILLKKFPADAFTIYLDEIGLK
jgi:hypothetical protein